MAGQGTFTWGQRLRYRFDNVFARGAVPVLLMVGAGLVILFVVGGLIQAIFGWGPDDESVPFFEGFWLSFVRSLDPGTFSGDQGTHFRVIGVVITLLGILAMAVVIGLVSSGIDTRLAGLREGRSLVVETDHTLILGSSMKVAAIVSELVEANASRKDAAIVVLTPDSPEDVDRMIRNAVPDLRSSRLVVRRGEPSNISDLAIANPAGARSVIILSSGDSGGDSAIVTMSMAVLRLTEGHDVPIVAEVSSRAVAEAIRIATNHRIILVVSSEVVGRVTAQVTRSVGLAAVYQELLDFTGDEVYLTPADPLESTTYGAALLAYEKSSLIGVQATDGSVTLNPDMDRVLTPGESLVLIAEDDSLIGVPNGQVAWDGQWAARLPSSGREPERTLVIGWNHLVPTIVHEIDSEVPQGSSIDIVVDPELVPSADVESFTLTNQEVRVHFINSLDLDRLEQLVRATDYQHVLVVCYRDVLEPDEADARVLLTLMATRQWTRGLECNVVAELLQVQNTELAAVARPDDFVVSERLMSLALAQISENPALAVVFHDLLDSFSVMVRMRPWHEYELGADANFAAIVAAARERGESAIGWRCPSMAGHARDLGGGVFINPPKQMQAAFVDEDQVIVIG